MWLFQTVEKVGTKTENPTKAVRSEEQHGAQQDLQVFMQPDLFRKITACPSHRHGKLMSRVEARCMDRLVS